MCPSSQLHPQALQRGRRICPQGGLPLTLTPGGKDTSPRLPTGPPGQTRDPPHHPVGPCASSGCFFCKRHFGSILLHTNMGTQILLSDMAVWPPRDTESFPSLGSVPASGTSGTGPSPSATQPTEGQRQHVRIRILTRGFTTTDPRGYGCCAAGRTHRGRAGPAVFMEENAPLGGPTARTHGAPGAAEQSLLTVDFHWWLHRDERRVRWTFPSPSHLHPLPPSRLYPSLHGGGGGHLMPCDEQTVSPKLLSDALTQYLI